MAGCLAFLIYWFFAGVDGAGLLIPWYGSILFI